MSQAEIRNRTSGVHFSCTRWFENIEVNGRIEGGYEEERSAVDPLSDPGR